MFKLAIIVCRLWVFCKLGIYVMQPIFKRSELYISLKLSNYQNVIGYGLCLSILALASSYSFAESESHNPAQLPTISIHAEKQQQPYKSGNMDIVRTEDDVQAYTIIDSKKIEDSGASNVSELLTKLLPMATSTPSYSMGGFTTSSSQINLRGLGTSQTLVLINGRRTAGIGVRGTSESTDQPNLNNIPLAAIERIEILPTSAAAIYGSGAVGGVINVILKRNYSGTEVDLRYGNTTDNKQDVKSINLVSGFSLEDGRTNVMITASRKDQDWLLEKDRKWKTMGRDAILRNNPKAIYDNASPPAGNLVNIRTADNSPLMPGSQLPYGHIPKGWDGNINNLGKGYALGLSDGMSSWSGDTTIMEESKAESASLSINRNFTDKLNIYLEGSFDRDEGTGRSTPHGWGTVTIPGMIKDSQGNKTLNPNNPFGKDIKVTYPVQSGDLGEYAFNTYKNETKKISTGFTFDITPAWIVSGDYTWSKSSNIMAYPRKGSNNPKAIAWNNDLGQGLIDLIKDTTTESTDVIQKYWNIPNTKTEQTLQDFALRATGPVVSWYAGDINFATGIEHRRIESDGYAEHQQVDNPWRKPTERKQNTTSLYGEFNIPLISPELEIPFAKLLDVQLAARYERFDVEAWTPQYVKDTKTGYNSILTGYSHQEKTKYDAVTPTIGFRFAPNDQLMFRASYSEGFVAPTVAQVGEPTSSLVTNATLIDPVTGKLVTDYTSISGGNPNITPEESKSYNFGVVLTPTAVPNLRVSADYFKIKKTNNITSVSADYILKNLDIYADRVKRDAAGNVESIDTTSFNALGLETSGLDTSLNYWFDSAMGRTSFNLGYVYTDKYLQQQSMTSPVKDFVGTKDLTDAPLKHRANASLFLEASPVWGFGWSSQFYNSYVIRNEAAITNQTGTTEKEYKIAHQIYHDVFARAKLPLSKLGAVDSAELTFGISNLFNDYQMDMSGSNYISQYSDPRGRQYYLNLKFTF